MYSACDIYILYTLYGKCIIVYILIYIYTKFSYICAHMFIFTYMENISKTYVAVRYT